jgi:fumarate hydratase class II
LAAARQISHRLLPALQSLQQALSAKAEKFQDVFKIGRTHLQDATPIRLGQEFSGYAAQLDQGRLRLTQATQGLSELALGGTAVGTGINAAPGFAVATIAGLAEETGLPLREARNHFAAQASLDPCVQASAALKSLALSFVKIANDIRWLASGPRCGLGEIILPATQPGSSIMPGKVNPVMCEMMLQVCAQVLGNDAVLTFSATQGAFELNTMLPVAAYNLLQSIELLSRAAEVFEKRCVIGLEADREKCASTVEKSLAMCTPLANAIGYDKAARIAKLAWESDRTIGQVAATESGLSPQELARLLDPANLT